MDYDPDWMGWTMLEAFFAFAACLKVHVRMPWMLWLQGCWYTSHVSVLIEGLCGRGGGKTGGAEPVGLFHRHGLCLEHRPGLYEHITRDGLMV